MKGNIITYVKNPDNILELLPSLPNKENFQIAFVGKHYNKEKACSLLKVRRSNIEKALYKLKSINEQYLSIKISAENLSKLPIDDIPTCLIEDALIVDTQDNNQTNIGYDNIDRNDINLINNDDQDNYFLIESSTITNSIESLTLNDYEQLNILKSSYNKNKQNDTNIIINDNKYLRAEYGNEPVNEINNPLHLINAFPTLFPYAIGGIGAKRKISLTYREHVNYLLKLNSDRFRTHFSFIFVLSLY
jgi:hypothetical protein